MITITLIILAAFFNAVMDAVENENFSESIFKNLPVQFWYKRESWKYAPKLFGYKFDAWHISKSLMIMCMLSTYIFYTSIFSGILDILFFGAVWNLSFKFFYHFIFKVK